MDEPLSSSTKKNKVDFLLLVVIISLENLVCLEEVYIILCFIVCVMLSVCQRICWRNSCRKREIQTLISRRIS